MTDPEHDRRLVQETLDGSHEAFAGLVERYQRPIYGFVLRMVREPAAAEDVAQETFIKAYGALATFDPSRKFSSWLFKIARNAAIDLLRRRRPEEVPLEQPDGELGHLDRVAAAGAGPERRAESASLAAAMEAAVADLRPAYREVVLLRFGQDMAYEEIAAVTGLPLGTVKTHIHRARKELAARLEAEGWAPGGETKRSGGS